MNNDNRDEMLKLRTRLAPAERTWKYNLFGLSGDDGYAEISTYK